MSAAGGGGVWGWGSSWGLGAIGGKLSGLAAGLSDLQQALANPESTDEEEDYEEEEEEAQEGSHGQPPPPAPQQQQQSSWPLGMGGLLTGVARSGWTVGQVLVTQVKQ